MLRRPLDFTTWVLWFLATAGPCAVWALSVYLRTRTDLDVILDTLYYEASVGLVIGALQSLVLRRYLFGNRWWTWCLQTWVGWLLALVFLIFGFVFSVGVMMNDATFANSPSLQCIWLFASSMAGWSVGVPQSAYLSRYRSALKSLWIAVSAGALMFASFLGRFGGMIAYKVVTGDRYLYYHSPEHSLSMAIGVLVAGIFFGAITGGMLIWALRDNVMGV